MVRYDAADEPNKYGFTKKMTKIWDLVESDETLEAADFEPTEEDIKYFKYCKFVSDCANEGNTGKRKKVIRFFDD